MERGREVSNNKMLTVREFAQLIGFSEYTVREKCRARCFKFARRVGNRWRFTRSEALKYAGEAQAE